MESIEKYVEELFEGRDLEDEAVKAAQKEVKEKLQELYQEAQKEVVPEMRKSAKGEKPDLTADDKIMGLVKQRFGVFEAVRSMVIHHQIEIEYEEFMDGFSKKIRAGVAGILIIPIVFLMLMFTQDSKPVFLSLWIFSILSIAAYLIALEYKKFQYEERLEIQVIKKDRDLQTEEESNNSKTQEQENEGI